MVQVLGRLAMAIGAFIVAGLGGLLASVLPYWQVFLIALVVPLISISGAALVAIGPVERRPIDWRILGGGIAFGAFAGGMALADLTLGPGDRVRRLDGGGVLDAGARDRQRRGRDEEGDRLCRR